MQPGVRDVSKHLNVSEKPTYQWVNQGILPAYRVNEQSRFNRPEHLGWATSRRRKPADEGPVGDFPGRAQRLR